MKASAHTVSRSATLGWQAVAGGLTWIVFALATHPSPWSTTWAGLLLVFAVLVIMPLGLQLIERGLGDESPMRPRRLWSLLVNAQFPAALALLVSIVLAPGLTAAVLSAAWFLWTVLAAGLGLKQILRRGLSWHTRVWGAPLVYLPIGGGSAVLDRLALRPLDFEPVIVLLTAVHFHYAAFALSLVAVLVLARERSRAAWVAVIGTLVAPPLVAIGITATKLGCPPWLEFAASAVMAASGLGVAVLQSRLVSRSDSRPARWLWAISASSLYLGMLLAALYGTRFFLPIPWLDIPWMRVTHGSMNAFGFALCGMLGWLVAKAGSSMRE